MQQEYHGVGVRNLGVSSEDFSRSSGTLPVVVSTGDPASEVNVQIGSIDETFIFGNNLSGSDLRDNLLSSIQASTAITSLFSVAGINASSGITGVPTGSPIVELTALSAAVDYSITTSFTGTELAGSSSGTLVDRTQFVDSTVQITIPTESIDQTVTLNRNLSGSTALRNNLLTLLQANTALTDEFTITSDTASGITGVTDGEPIVKLVANDTTDHSITAVFTNGAGDLSGSAFGTLIEGGSTVTTTSTAVRITYPSGFNPSFQDIVFGAQANAAALASAFVSMTDGHGMIDAEQGTGANTNRAILTVTSAGPHAEPTVAVTTAGTTSSPVSAVVGTLRQGVAPAGTLTTFAVTVDGVALTSGTFADNADGTTMAAALTTAVNATQTQTAVTTANISRVTSVASLQQNTVVTITPGQNADGTTPTAAVNRTVIQTGGESGGGTGQTAAQVQAAITGRLNDGTGTPTNSDEAYTTTQADLLINRKADTASTVIDTDVILNDDNQITGISIAGTTRNIVPGGSDIPVSNPTATGQNITGITVDSDGNLTGVTRGTIEAGGNIEQWTTATAYSVGDLVITIYSNALTSLWRCHTAHTSDNTAGGVGNGQPRPDVDNNNWSEVSATGVHPWVTGFNYAQGNIVSYSNGFNSGLYQRKIGGSDTGSSQAPDVNHTDWRFLGVQRFADSDAWEAQPSITSDIDVFITTSSTYNATQANAQLTAAGYIHGDAFHIISRDTTYEVITTGGNLALQFLITSRDSITALGDGQDVLDSIAANAAAIAAEATTRAEADAIEAVAREAGDEAERDYVDTTLHVDAADSQSYYQFSGQPAIFAEDPAVDYGITIAMPQTID